MTHSTEATHAFLRGPAIVFVNPSAGRGRARAYLPRLRRLFESLEMSSEFVETDSAADLELAARQSVSHDQQLLLALGGDGTFQALANGAFEGSAILGILPAGGGNDFAAALGLPNDPLVAGEAIVKDGKPRYVDLVRARTADGRTRLYAGGGGVGLDAEAARQAAGAYRRFPGRLRYVAAALRALYEHQPLNVRIEFPGADQAALETSSLLTSVLNTPTYGAGLRLAPGASIDDGMLNLVLIESLSKPEVLRLLPRLVGTGDLRTSRIKRWSIKRVKISTNRPSFFHGDGELLGPAPVEIEVVPKAVRVLVPGFR